MQERLISTLQSLSLCFSLATVGLTAHAADSTARMGCLHDAEDLLISDCVMAPLYTRGTAWELRETLTGACRDGRGWFNFANTIPKAA